VDSRDQARRVPPHSPQAGYRGASFHAPRLHWTERYPRISAAVAALRTASLTIDGEAVCCDDAGVALFEKLHSRAHDGEAFLYAFDLLELDGEDWRLRSLDGKRFSAPTL
jgi:ATP-dependent DNA ligase